MFKTFISAESQYIQKVILTENNTMTDKNCCEEMSELLKGLTDSPKKGVKALLTEDGIIDEVVIEGEGFIPNIIFRFCPFCGHEVSAKADAKKSGFQLDLEKIIGEEIDESTPDFKRAALAEDKVGRIKSLVAKSAAKGVFA
jgi:hypothetical protein